MLLVLKWDSDPVESGVVGGEGTFGLSEALSAPSPSTPPKACLSLPIKKKTCSNIKFSF